MWGSSFGDHTNVVMAGSIGDGVTFSLASHRDDTKFSLLLNLAAQAGRLFNGYSTLLRLAERKAPQTQYDQIREELHSVAPEFSDTLAKLEALCNDIERTAIETLVLALAEGYDAVQGAQYRGISRFIFPMSSEAKSHYSAYQKYQGPGVLDEFSTQSISSFAVKVGLRGADAGP